MTILILVLIPILSQKIKSMSHQYVKLIFLNNEQKLPYAADVKN